MSTQPLTTDRDLDRLPSSTSRVERVARDETKPSFLTTEFYAMIAVIVGVLVAAQQASNLDAPLAWTLVAAVAIGYMVSRGLAKSGSSYRHRD